ncbi:hypothetical protein AB0D10_39375 [Kitasatospora sp. NPDC048545]|uniref:hypothetical protein n=1 Tax=Kitasatospora sp. NPDC048545 TaxID=3157208 RepID=UPI003401ACA6
MSLTNSWYQVFDARSSRCSWRSIVLAAASSFSAPGESTPPRSSCQGVGLGSGDARGRRQLLVRLPLGVLGGPGGVMPVQVGLLALHLVCHHRVPDLLLER